MNLQELIDKPGYGSHVKMLQKEGKWDEYAGMPVKDYVVTVAYTSDDYIKVKARCEDEAFCKANKTAAEKYDNFELTECEECT